MRSGKLLAQSKPDDLIRAFNVIVSVSITLGMLSYHEIKIFRTV